MKKEILKLFSFKIRKSLGQTLVELLLTIGLSAILFPALLTGFMATRTGRAQQEERLTALAYFKEAEEAIRIVSANAWSNITDGTFHPIPSGTSWALSANSETLDSGIFTRQIIISGVYRDSNGNIAGSGTLDPSTKKAVISVSWGTPIASSVSTTTYLTRHTSLNHTDTKTTDFTGTVQGATVAATLGTSIPNDGQIQLSAGGGGDWCSPSSYILATYDLTRSGVPIALSATASATQDFAYTTTGDNASGDSVDSLTITHDSTPTITNPNSNNEAKAYGIYVDKLNNHVYFNENNPPHHTVRIAHGTTLVNEGYFDTGSNGTGTSVFVSGNTGYTTVGSKLYAFDVTTINGSSSQSQLGSSVDIAGTGNRVVVIGNNAYIATSSTTNQLQIVNVSNPSSMSLSKSISVGNNLAGVDVYVNSSQTYAYLVTTYASGKNDFFIINLSSVGSSCSFSGTVTCWGFSTSGMNPKGITVVPSGKAILVGSGGTVYQVFKNVDTPASASYCGGVTPNGVTSVNAVAPMIEPNGNAFSYIITDNASAEFQIIQGGPGGQFSPTGTYTSPIYDVGSDVFINRFYVNHTVPSSTTVSYQVAVAAAVSGSCASAAFAYSGPYATSSALPSTISDANYKNPGRCLRYKVNLSTTDITQSPVLSDITVNYSP